ncbi:MAG: transcriptional regulator BetI [Pseudomonadota bacterium]
MPKVGMEPIRRKALVDAAITAIGESGSLDVRVSDIAGIAGVSPALAHHYFGGKEQLLEAALRHILVLLKAELLPRLAKSETPRERLSAIVAASFSPSQFEPATISAWLNFYIQAMSNDKAARLLNIYARRLHDNLVHEFVRLMPRAKAEQLADSVAALIDGYWLRSALGTRAGGEERVRDVIETYIDLSISHENGCCTLEGTK